MKKSTGVGSPIGQAGDGIIQPGANLPDECQPIAVNIPGPDRRGVTLRARISAARKNHHPLAGIGAALALISGLTGKERIGIAHAIGRAKETLDAIDRIPVIAWLGRVLPKTISSEAVKGLVHVFPTEAPNGRI